MRIKIALSSGLTLNWEHLKIISSSFENGYEEWGLVDENTALKAREMEKISKDVVGTLFSGMFQVIDTDANGTISFKEWRASFDAMDTNGDNDVSMEEFDAYNKEFSFSAEDTLHSSILYAVRTIFC